ncbi:MAG: polymer-forming cytoskeletal protein [Candidatus Thiodiazotropha sp.]|nr:polymer-forming cytoskeletal protein [Candidatus Thiodiazotropha taylori]MBT3057583.1 polymer-forming cytoskeletal protein [Candidatus Thiodiazotropha sp. (ex Lucina pensylvanica)]MBV2095998.1 polymer-forming cytoskeletal protein [Candidatus Thiodiazotropha sp. (ex Codakia orbicularis)]PUB76275.1 MAG: polymer-forming cytoskeletal protein [gamma proteobacterium symbiont of Ctena orbiculata]MBT3064043.1 polymer-forming cytoskeletal protein [Candidatus Thiodiazotropha sp. (ex Lucina pensylvanic
MFDRNKRETQDDSGDLTPSETRRSPENFESKTRVREAAVIGPSIQINGDLSGEEDLIIQGKVSGTIQLREKSLTVGKQGQVDANVLAHSIIIEGKVNGDLYGSERVSIRNTGNVNGNIVSPKVSLDEGCRFKGSIDMDPEMVNKAVGKSGAPSAIPKPDTAASKPRKDEIGKPGKTEKPTPTDKEINSGSMG